MHITRAAFYFCCSPISIAFAIVIENSIAIQLDSNPRFRRIFFKRNNVQISFCVCTKTDVCVCTWCAIACAFGYGMVFVEREKRYVQGKKCEKEIKSKLLCISNWLLGYFLLLVTVNWAAKAWTWLRPINNAVLMCYFLFVSPQPYCSMSSNGNWYVCIFFCVFVTLFKLTLTATATASSTSIFAN